MKEFEVVDHKIDLREFGWKPHKIELIIMHSDNFEKGSTSGAAYKRWIPAISRMMKSGGEEPRGVIIATLENGRAWVMFDSDDIGKTDY